MKRFLSRSWFLLLLLLGAVLAGVVPAWFGWAGRIDPRYVVAPAMFLMGWTLPSRSLARVLVRPGPALWAMAISYGALPAAAWAASALLPVDDFRIGLLIVSAVPCTLASAVLWTRMGHGDDATALLVVLLTTATSWLVTPAWLALTTGTVVDVNTVAMMRDLLLTLVLPVALGQVGRMPEPLARAALHHKRLLSVISQLLILVILLKAAVYLSVRLRQEKALPSGLAVAALVGTCIGLHLLALAAGLWSSRGFGLDRASQVAVAFACSQKTLPVALLVFERYFSAFPLAVVPLVIFHFGQLLVDTFIAERLKHLTLASPLAHGG